MTLIHMYSIDSLITFIFDSAKYECDIQQVTIVLFLQNLKITA